MRPWLGVLGAVALGCAGGGTSPEGPTATTPTATTPTTPTTPTATPTPAAAPAARCGPDIAQIAFWQGEYPGPIVDVRRPVTVPTRADPCDAEATRTCELPVGVYHPWSRGEAFVTLRPRERFRVAAPFTLGEGGPALAAGAEVTVEGYAGEGYCLYGVAGVGVTASCPGMDDAIALEPLGAPVAANSGVQLFRDPCGTWVQVDDALMGTDGIGEGTVLGYGEVGPGRP